MDTRKRSRIPFHWRPRDCSIDALSGQLGTYIGAGQRGLVLDANGRYYEAVHSQSRWHYIGGRPWLLLERAATNLCLQSENLGTTWVAIGTPTRVAGLHTLTGIALDLIGDDDGAVAEGYEQTIGFTGNFAKSIGFRLKAHSAGTTVVRLRDVTASVSRLEVSIVWNAGVPTASIVGGAGVILGVDPLIDGGYAFRCRSNAVTAANSNRLQIYPAGLVVGQQGKVFAGGFQAHNAPFCPSYVKTTVATVTTADEYLRWDALLQLGTYTGYIEMLELGLADLAAWDASYNHQVCGIGNAAGNSPNAQVFNNGQYFHSVNNAVPQNAYAQLGGALPAAGQRTELLFTWRNEYVSGKGGVVTLERYADDVLVGAIVTDTSNVTDRPIIGGLPANAQFTLNADAAGANVGAALYGGFKLMEGLQAVPFARRAF